MDNWEELWKLISDVRKVDRQVFFGIWEVICEGDELDENKAKKAFSDPDSEYCLDWNKDAKGLRFEVCDWLKIWSDEHEAEDLERQRQDKLDASH
tara:strand:+ start:481 stop:765 length:285 start_codon:yes stop_codon:yes gene_type:complete